MQKRFFPCHFLVRGHLVELLPAPSSARPPPRDPRLVLRLQLGLLAEHLEVEDEEEVARVEVLPVGGEAAQEDLGGRVGVPA